MKREEVCKFLNENLAYRAEVKGEKIMVYRRYIWTSAIAEVSAVKDALIIRGYSEWNKPATICGLFLFGCLHLIWAAFTKDKNARVLRKEVESVLRVLAAKTSPNLK